MVLPTTADTAQLDTRAAIREAVDVTANLWRGVATVDIDAPEGLPWPPTRAGEIEQVRVAPIVNAVHAIGAITRRGLQNELLRIRGATG